MRHKTPGKKARRFLPRGAQAHSTRKSAGRVGLCHTGEPKAIRIAHKNLPNPRAVLPRELRGQNRGIPNEVHPQSAHF